MAMSHSLLYGIRTEGCYPYPYTGDALSHFGGEYGKLYTCSEVRATLAIRFPLPLACSISIHPERASWMCVVWFD